MNLFKPYQLFFLIITVLVAQACNTTDTGVSRPVPDCFDGLQNQGEMGVDCGGPCFQLCPSKMTAKINGASWESAGSITSFITGPQLRIIGSNGSFEVQLNHDGAFETGTYVLNEAMVRNFTTGHDYVTDEGEIIFTAWNTSEKQVSGSFSFKAWEMLGAQDTVYITQGTFESVNY